MSWLAIKAILIRVPMWVWVVLALVASHATVYMIGRHHEAKDNAYEAAKALANQKKKQDKVTIKVVTKYVDRVQVIREKAKTIIEKVPVYVTAENDAACVIPDSFISLWNYANEGSIPGTAIRVDEGTGKASEAETGR